MSHYQPYTQRSDIKIPPPQMLARFNLYESKNTEPGIQTLQSEMGLIDDPDLFSETLANIREIWRQHGVDRNVSYRLQDPITLKIVKERALNEMPFLRERYEDGWPVAIYLERSLQNRVTVAAQRAFDEGPYRFRGRRFVVVDPEDKVKDNLRSRCHPELCSTGAMGYNMKSEPKKPASC